MGVGSLEQIYGEDIVLLAEQGRRYALARPARCVRDQNCKDAHPPTEDNY